MFGWEQKTWDHTLQETNIFHPWEKVGIIDSKTADDS